MLCFGYKVGKTNSRMKREEFLQVVSKESIEDFLRYTQSPVSEPVWTFITSGVISLMQKSCDRGTENICGNNCSRKEVQMALEGIEAEKVVESEIRMFINQLIF